MFPVGALNMYTISPELGDRFEECPHPQHTSPSSHHETRDVLQEQERDASLTAELNEMGGLQR